jgi:hypothetical protein
LREHNIKISTFPPHTTQVWRYWCERWGVRFLACQVRLGNRPQNWWR